MSPLLQKGDGNEMAEAPARENSLAADLRETEAETGTDPCAYTYIKMASNACKSPRGERERQREETHQTRKEVAIVSVC